MADIEDRLKSHSSAFEGLLSLIPANKYFEGDSSSQWSKRKQTKEEHKRAKKAKLDPDSATTAAEFRKKRQREVMDAEDVSRAGGVAEEEVMGQQPKTKKPKKERKPKAQQQQQPVPKIVAPAGTKTKAEANGTSSPRKKKGKESAARGPEAAPAPPADSDEEEAGGAADAIQINGFADLADQGPSSSPSAATTDPASPPSTTTTATTTATTKPPKPTFSPAARAEQRARLAARIEALRATRKADNIDGSSARTRQELMEARRKKEALRKERKKAARLAAKLSTGATAAIPASDAATAATAAAPSADAAAKSTANAVSVVKNFSFGRVTFDDGRQLDPTLTDFKKEKRRAGPRDLLGQLKHTEAKKRRIENMSDDKKEAILEKEKWSKALKQTSGEKVKDDEGLLKKALKRQEATKRKSSSEWSERLAGQAKAKSLRIKKREENIQARKDAKKAGKSGKKGGTKKGAAKPGGKNGKKKAPRPGFEGAMKTGGKGIPNGKGKK